MVLEQIEPPLLQAVMEKYKYNQSRAANALGISRGTFRALLFKYFDEKYCGRRLEKNPL
jgi:Fis family transcriptional regulator